MRKHPGVVSRCTPSFDLLEGRSLLSGAMPGITVPGPIFAPSQPSPVQPESSPRGTLGFDGGQAYQAGWVGSPDGSWSSRPGGTSPSQPFGQIPAPPAVTTQPPADPDSSSDPAGTAPRPRWLALCSRRASLPRPGSSWHQASPSPLPSAWHRARSPRRLHGTRAERIFPRPSKPDRPPSAPRLQPPSPAPAKTSWKKAASPTRFRSVRSPLRARPDFQRSVF